ncbi:MAG TPA: hypothetical protein VLQ48_09600 [Chloroflexia bacterium]|nr:hypothetical protein [Chloroflexia bacterium]
MKRNVIGTKLKRTALMGVVGGLAMVGLAACGSPAATPVPPAATSAPTTAASAATATKVPTAASIATATSKPTTPATEVMPVGTATTESMIMDMPTDVPVEAPTQAAVVPEATATTASGQSAGDTAVSAVLREWAIDLSTSEVPAGDITFTVTNKGVMSHNLTVVDSTGSVIGATPTFSGRQGAQTLEVTLAPGTYTLLCSLPGHAAQGQKTTLVVK